MSKRPFIPKRALYAGRCCPCPGPDQRQTRRNDAVRRQGGGFGRVQPCACWCHKPKAVK